jgi:hypothetical protein
MLIMISPKDRNDGEDKGGYTTKRRCPTPKPNVAVR